MARFEDSESLGRLVDLVRARTCLQVSERNLDLLVAFASRRLEALGVAPDVYLERVAASSPDSGELELVARELTVGETYFFRGPAFGALRDVLLPELAESRRREGARTMRLLSAGCASGEEAYSLAMALVEVLEGDTEGWDVSVIGLDLNTAFLRRAARAEYGRWSLRDVAPPTVARHFEEGAWGYRVRPALQRLVRFHYCNLATDPLPAPALGVFGMDLIVCQNVLYYFERRARTDVIAKLVQCAAPRGHLLFGAADLFDPTVEGCRPRVFGEVIAFERLAASEPASAADAAPSIAPKRTARPVSGRPSRRSGAPVAARTETSRARSQAPPRDAGHGLEPTETPERDAAGAPSAPTALDEVRNLANEGNLRGAVERIEAILADDGGTTAGDRAEAHGLHGLLLGELGALQPALDAFRRALYLEPGLLVAHAGSAMIARRLGDHELARRFATRLAALAGARPADEPVAGWKGMTVGRLARLFADPSESTQ